MKMFDCLIVGAGPAGGSAAYHLAKRGRSVLVLEKATLPRYKPCGGGVSPIVQDWFDFDFTPAISYTVDSVCYTWNQGDRVEASLGTQEPIWMVRREVFDNFLVEQAQKQGATVRDRTKVLGATWQGSHWQVQTTHEPVTAKYLIAADGSKGVMAKHLGFTKRKHFPAGALEVEIPLATQAEKHVYFEFGLLSSGYAWNFPKADAYSMGVGVCWRKDKQPFKSLLSQYATLFQVDPDTEKQYGHPIFLWNGKQKLHTQNALLAGEAACVVDPFTAEGIRPSMFSGVQAAAAIDRAIAGDLNALATYSQTINEEWGTEMAWAKRLAQAFTRLPRLGYKVGIKQFNGTQVMGQILSGERKYSQVVGKALRRLLV